MAILVRTIVLTLLLAWSSTPPLDEGEEFVSQLDTIQALLDEKGAEAAQRRLEELLSEFEGSRVAKFHRDRVLQLSAACAFQRTHEEPGLLELVGGTVEPRWDRRRKSLTIRYEKPEPTRRGKRTSRKAARPEAWSDVADGRPFICPVPFDGTCKVTVSGRLGRSTPRQPRFLLHAEDGLVYVMDVSWPYTSGPGRRVGSWNHGRATVVDGEVEHLLGHSTVPGVKFGLEPDGSYRANLLVKSDSFTCNLEQIGMLTAEKRERTYGRLAIENFPGLELVEFEGKVEPDTLEGLAKEFRDAARARALAEADPEELLPEWLR